jgi:hypothetical protein
MPVCPRCDVAYLDSETHKCEPTASQWAVGAGVVAGVVTGGAFGFVVCLFGFALASGGDAQSGLGALFIGTPVGAIIGAIIGWRAAR